MNQPVILYTFVLSNQLDQFMPADFPEPTNFPETADVQEAINTEQ